MDGAACLLHHFLLRWECAGEDWLGLWLNVLFPLMHGRHEGCWGRLILVWAVCNTGIYTLQSPSQLRALLHFSPCQARLPSNYLLLASTPASVLFSFCHPCWFFHLSMYLYLSFNLIPSLLHLPLPTLFANRVQCPLILKTIHEIPRIHLEKPLPIKQSRQVLHCRFKWWHINTIKVKASSWFRIMGYVSTEQCLMGWKCTPSNTPWPATLNWT